MVNCSIGIMAYNEGNNIGLFLDSLFGQKLSSVSIEEVIVVSSGCSDKTENIVNEFAGKEKKIKLLTQKEREGKISAINLYLQITKSDIVSIVNADLILKKDTIEKLICPFADPKVGMTGGRAIPLDEPDSFTGFAAHLLWGLHHEMALRFPKLGEMVAYRRLDHLQFPPDTVDDEGIVEATMVERGFKLRYVPDAIFNNLNPQTIGELIKRRRNIFAGHVQLKKRTGYTVSTADVICLLKVLPFAIFKYTGFNLKLILWAILLAGIELWARILGIYDFYIRKKDHSIWEIAKTSKRRIT